MPLPLFSAFHPSALVERREESIDHIVFSVRTTDAMRAAFTRPGQFVKMRVADDAGAPDSPPHHDGIFAIATAPHEGALRFLARMNNPVGGEAADRLARMPLGTPLEITLPTGDGFALERARGRDLALLAVGTALAPLRSALEVVLRERDAYGALSVDYGLRSMEHLPFADDLERWRRAGVALALHVGTTRESGIYDGVRAQDALFERLGARAARTAILAVGHDALVREVRARYADAGGDAELVLHNY